MKSGVSLQQMLTEVKRQSESKEDYLIAPNRLRMESYGKEMFLHLSDDSGTELIEPMTITGIAHRQIGTHLRIPAAYYDRMREERPDLLAYNANTWFKQENSQRMLRTLDGSARAYLSNRYRRIDNIDIAGVTLPILGGLPDIRFESCQITESRMYIYNFRSPEIEAGESMLAANGISFFPYPSRYAVRYEGESPYTAMEFAKQIKNHSLAELLSMQLLPYEILEIDDGIRPYCFLVERLGHVRCIRFKSDIARESKYEESGGKAI